MKHICPVCEKETEVRKVNTCEVFNIKGEEISVPVEYFQCLECNESFDDALSTDDPIDLAYKEYRERNNMIQPDQIKAFRKKYGLTQKELSALLGWGGATLSRYENGALQDDTHETALRLIMEPENLLKLVKEKTKALPIQKRKELMEELNMAEQKKCSFKALFENRFAIFPPDIFNGYKSLDVAKLYNTIIYFCMNGVLKTKLNKLLFYADFKYFKENSISITGLRYLKYKHGPVPEKYDFYFASLHNDEKAIRVEEEVCFNYIGEKFTSEFGPDLSIFSKSEIDIMEYVSTYFKDFNSTQISDFAHKEPGYTQTDLSGNISYAFSESLQI